MLKAWLNRPAFFGSVIIVLLIYIAVLHYVKYHRYPPKTIEIIRDDNEYSAQDAAKHENMKIEISELRQEIEHLKNTPCGDKNKETTTIFDRHIPNERNLDRDVDILTTLVDFQRRVTVLVDAGDRSPLCILEQITQIHDKLPNANIILSLNRPVEHIDVVFSGVVTFLKNQPGTTEGFALNKMISMVKTDYFLYMSRGDVISEYGSGSSPGWLYRALEKIPELDIVGGSFLLPNSSLKYAQLVIQCHRLKLCYWTLKQSYEYKYSVGDMMVCEETSSTFMARTARIIKLGRFDETLQDMTTTDFFLRVKGKAVVGLMPEIYFHVSKTCATKELNKNAESLKKQSFMDKYSLRRIVDSFGKKTDYPVNRVPSQTIQMFPSMSYLKQGGVNYPQSTETLQYFVRYFDDFFNHYNLTYILVAGIPLGGIKVRDVLMWDSGDIDLGFFGVKWEKVLALLKEYMAKTGARFSHETHQIQDAPSGSNVILVRTSPVTNGVHCDLYSRQYVPTPRPDEFMYIFIHDRYIPVFRGIFSYFRLNRIYLINYLAMQFKHKPLRCTVPGHHACVPKQFANGGGHWSNFYCK